MPIDLYVGGKVSFAYTDSFEYICYKGDELFALNMDRFTPPFVLLKS